MALATVQQYVTTARALLQDTVVPYRYSDANLAIGLSLGFLEARRLRPDLFLGRFDNIPNFTTVDSTAVDMDEQYRVPLLYYMVGHVQLFDEEDTQDARAAVFLNKFTSQMLVVKA
jgi:hypothetical protein